MSHRDYCRPATLATAVILKNEPVFDEVAGHQPASAQGSLIDRLSATLPTCRPLTDRPWTPGAEQEQQS